MANNGYIKSLDGLRAIAIMLVMTYHSEITHFGWTGVQLFFVLSGFLITGILWKERSKEGSLGFKFKKFWVRRSLRIFPLYFGYIGIISLSYLFFHFPSYYPTYAPYLWTYTVNFTRLLPGWQGNPLFTHLWSLSIEEQFYLLFPFIILLCPPRWIKGLLISILFLSPLFRYLLGQHYAAEGMDPRTLANAVNFHTISHLDAFCMGGLIPVLSLDKRVKKPRIILLVVTLLVGLAGLLSFLTSPHPDGYLLDLGFNHWLINNYQYVWVYTAINLFSASLILFLTSEYSQRTGSMLRKIFENRILVSIGRISYGMYLFHWLILVYVFGPLFKPETIGMKMLMFIPYLIAVYFFSLLSYNLYEVRFIRLKDKLFTTPDTIKKAKGVVLSLLLLITTLSFSKNAQAQSTGSEAGAKTTFGVQLASGPGPGTHTVRKVGCGEYGRYILRAEDSLVYLDWWNGHAVALTPVNTLGNKIVDISGALYSAVGVDAAGTAWVFGQGRIDAIHITKDSSGAPFKGNIACTGYFGTYTTLKADGSIWLWGADAWKLFSANGDSALSKPMKLKQPPGVKFTKILAGNALLALASNGSVYMYGGNRGVPVKVALPRPASDIAASHTGFFLAILPDNIKTSKLGYPWGWGAESIYFGVPGPLAGPVALKNTWGLKVPIRRIVANHNTIHFIDSLGRLFGLGDNPNGEVGNGTELVNHAELYHPPAYLGSPYAWSWTKHEFLVSKPVQIGVGTTWKDIWCDNSYAFYHFAVDIHDHLYFWGRAKSWVSGRGHNNEDKYPNAFDVLSPTLITPFHTPNKGYGNFIKYTCNAGKDQTVTGESVNLKGSATPSTGYTIASYKWSKVSGPACHIEDPASPVTTVTGLKPGTYLFSLLMTDNNTATISDTVAVKVTH